MSMKHKILIIEDNRDVRENLREILMLSGYETSTAATGTLGVEAAIQFIPDLILCDVMMPELDGYGVLRILSKNQITSSIPFIFLTAKTEMSDLRKGMTLGADDYITKPFDDVALLDTIEIRLQKKKVPPQHDAATPPLNILTGEQVLPMIPKEFREGEPRQVSKKDLLYTEGQPCRYVYIITSGRAIATKANDYSKEVIPRIYQHPDIIGITSVLTGSTYTETIRAFEDLEVILVKQEEFLQSLFNDKSLLYYFLKKVADDLVRADEKLLIQAYSPVRVRLAHVLIELYRSYEQDGKAIIPVPREDLAFMAGTAKETIIRSLSELKDEGLVTIAGTDIIIDNILGLMDLRY